MKFKIALCDDDAKLLAVIAGAAESVLMDHGIRAEVHRFQTGAALLDAMERNHFQMVLLDINMPEMDGIAVGRVIRERKVDTQIIYVSEWEGRVFEALLNRPFGFVRKGQFLNDLTNVINLYMGLDTKEINNGHLQLTARDSLLTVEVKRIRYFEGNRNMQLMHLEGQEQPIEIKMTMNKLEEDTAEYGFIRIHKGYLVNYRYIQRIYYDKLVLRDGKELPIGRSKINEVKDQFLTLLED